MSRRCGLLQGPDARERERWLIATEAVDGNERVFRDMADATRDVGLPWLYERTSLDAMIYELQSGQRARATRHPS